MRRQKRGNNDLSSGAPDARRSSSDGSEEWGYIPVSPQASLFYWFFKTTHSDGHLNRPIILWLQGGPGISGSGVGNFLMLGPQNQNMTAREFTWVQSASILFVDYPGNTGFSVIDDTAFLAPNSTVIGEELVEMLKVFFREHQFYRRNKFFIFGQSNGGKMVPVVAWVLNKAIHEGEIECNLRGAAIGNGWVSASDIMVNWPDLLFQASLIDDIQMVNLTIAAWNGVTYAHREDWDLFSDEYIKILTVLARKFPFLNFYSVQKLYNIPVAENDFRKVPALTVYDIPLDDFMNGPVKQKLGIIPQDKLWSSGGFELALFYHNNRDDYRPVFHLVDDLLINTDIDIIIYQGTEDFICCTAGVLRWMSRLTWPQKQYWDTTERRTLTVPGTNKVEMFVKSHQKLKMYWFPGAGHVVPADVPGAAFRMLNRILDDTD